MSFVVYQIYQMMTDNVPCDYLHSHINSFMYMSCDHKCLVSIDASSNKINYSMTFFVVHDTL